MFLWLSLLTGIIYPLVVTLIAQMTMHHSANGSLITREEKVIGSVLIGQQFTSDKYFWSRPSAVDYNTLPSGGSNLGPTSGKLKALVEERRSKLLAGKKEGEVPTDLLFASGSGLDPHVSIEAISFQTERVLKARGLNKKEDREMLENLILQHTIKHFLKILSPDHVNVLTLNLALDEVAKKDD